MRRILIGREKVDPYQTTQSCCRCNSVKCHIAIPLVNLLREVMTSFEVMEQLGLIRARSAEHRYSITLPKRTWSIYLANPDGVAPIEV